MAKFCTQCGAKLDDDDLFCGVCGVSLVKQDTDDHSAEKSEPSAETPEYEPVSDQTTTVSQNNKKKPPAIALIMAQTQPQYRHQHHPIYRCCFCPV